MASGDITELKPSNTLPAGFVISDRDGNLMFRYQKKVFTPEEDNLRNNIYPVPKFAVVTSGAGEWNINKTIYNLHPGDIVILRPGCVRYFNNIDPNSPLTCEIYEFIPSFLRNMECLNLFRQNVTSANTLIPHRNGSNLELLEMFQKIKAELEATTDGCVDMIRVYFAMIVINAAKKLDIKIGTDRIIPWVTAENYKEAPPFEYSCNDRILIHNPDHALLMAYIMDEIRNGIGGNISIDKLASDAHMSRSHFYKLFRRYNGMSVNDFIQKCRIENTINLLIETGCKITDAAYASGFTSSSGFYKAFKKITGLAPKEYVQNLRSN